jgi:preprotein translocase subunit SecF
MFQIFTNINVDWMGYRKPLIALSVLVLVAGLVSAVGRQLTPGGTDAFNLGVDFQGGTVITAKFKSKPSEDDIRGALAANGARDAVIQASLDKVDEVLIKVPLAEAANGGAEAEGDTSQVNIGRQTVKLALDTLATEIEATANMASVEADKKVYQIVGTDSVGPVAGAELRNRAVTATLLGCVGILLFIAFRYDWTYAAGAVIAVFHDVLITLAFFSVFQWEVSLTVLAAMLTLVGFSVNDSIVIFDRIRENVNNNRNTPLYTVTNDSINQTMSRTVITGGLVFLSVLALVLFGGEVLRGFSLALFVGVIAGTYSTIAIASPIAIWWQTKIGAAEMKDVTPDSAPSPSKLASAARKSVARRPVTR